MLTFNHTQLFVNCLWIALASALLPSCAVSEPSIQYDTNGVEATLPFKVEGQSYVGTATVQRKSNQKFEFDFRDDLSWALFATCHRDFKIKNPKGLWVWRYMPAFLIENVNSCIMIHKQITKKGNEHYAIINFTAGETVNAEMMCNGVFSRVGGASLCQARAGTEQALRFSEPVEGFTDPTCGPLKQEDGYRMVYNISPAFCAYVFRNKAGEIHRHVTYGYEHLDLKE